MTIRYRPDKGRMREAINVGMIVAVAVALGLAGCFEYVGVSLGGLRRPGIRPWAALAMCLVGAAAGYAAARQSWVMSGRRVRHFRRTIGLCPSCGYNLAGNVSGVCPECGNDAKAPA